MLGARALWLKWRNTLLSDARFHRFAADFPLTRNIAGARTQALIDTVAGFVYAQIARACVQLEVLKRLSGGPQTCAALAESAGISEATMRTLLGGAEALELVEATGTHYVLGPLGAALIGNAGLADMIAHHDAFYDDLRDPAALLRRGRGENLPMFWRYTSDVGAPASAAVGAYSGLMAATQPNVARDVLDAYPLRRHRVVMDVGGGEGVFLNSALARWPKLKARLFDLPAVVERARLHGFAGEAVGGDFFADAWPAGADLICFVRVLHDHDDARALQLLAHARAALAPGGRILVAEPMLGRGRFAHAYLALYLFAMGRGRPRAPRELKAMAFQAGFARARMLRVRTPALLGLMVAEA